MATAKDIKKVTGTAHKEDPKPKATPTPQVKAKAVPKAKQEVKKAVPKPPFKVVTISLERIIIEPIIAVARDFTASKSAMPILTHILLNAGKDCTIVATDLDRSWTANLKYKGERVNRCIPVEILWQEIKALHSDIKEVRLTFSERAVKVNGRCEIYTLSAEEFPVIKEVTGTKVEIPDLRAGLKKVIPASSTDTDARYSLSTVLIDLPNGKLVATDGHRLHCTSIKKESTKKLLIPRESAVLAAKHATGDAITIGKDKGISFNTSTPIAGGVAVGVMTTVLVDADYPDYDKVIPKNNTNKVVFSGSELLKVLEGALPVGERIKMTINGKIEIHSQNPDLAIYKWHIPCEYKGKQFEIVFNAKYLVDAIRAFTTKEKDKVTLEIDTPLSPSLINGSAVVMPMRA